MFKAKFQKVQEKNWTFKPTDSKELPQQKNFNDCGVRSSMKIYIFFLTYHSLFKKKFQM